MIIPLVVSGVGGPDCSDPLTPESNSVAIRQVKGLSNPVSLNQCTEPWDLNGRGRRLALPSLLLLVWPCLRHWIAMDLCVLLLENRINNTCPIQRRNEVMFVQHSKLTEDNECILLNSNNNNHYCKSNQ